MRKGNFSNAQIKENVIIFRSIYVFQTCSTCKKKVAIVLKSFGYNRVLFSKNISITRKKINKQTCCLDTTFYEENFFYISTY